MTPERWLRATNAAARRVVRRGIAVRSLPWGPPERPTDPYRLLREATRLYGRLAQGYVERSTRQGERP